MKKTALFVLLCSAFIFLLSLNSFAFNEEGDSYIDESSIYSVFDSVDSETKDILTDIGVDEFDTEKIFKISPERIIDELISVVSNKIISPVKLCFTLISIMIIQSAVKSVTNEKDNSVSDIVFLLLITTASAAPAYSAVTLAASHLLTVSDFMIAFIPIYAFILSYSGNFTQALNFNTLLFSASQLIISFSDNYLIPVTGMLMSMNIASAVNPVLSLESLSKGIKKAITVILTFISTLFIGFLSLKGNIASSVDSLTIRSIRTVSGSVIPFVGSALADSYSSVLGSLKLINDCFGFLGITVLCVMNLPVIIELLLYIFSFRIAAMIGEMLGCENSKILNSIADILAIANTVVLIVTVVFTVSTGLMLKARTY